jgi:large subunit ribosomal protein L7Ae
MGKEKLVVASGKKVVAPAAFEKAKAPAAKKQQAAAKERTFHEVHAHLFGKNPKNLRAGGDFITKKDLTRFVRWPRYVRLQRQRAVIHRRLKVPPALNQFSKTLEQAQAKQLFALLSKYRPETKKEKHARLLAAAKADVAGVERAKDAKPKTIKFGLSHITTLIESKKAKLVVIAHDVDPIELVVWLPALCRKLDVPYCIVKGKARLGELVHQKTATAVCLTDVRKEDAKSLDDLVHVCRPLFNENVAILRKWGGGILGHKAQARMLKQKKAVAGASKAQQQQQQQQ